MPIKQGVKRMYNLAFPSKVKRKSIVEARPNRRKKVEKINTVDEEIFF